jgi:hypothetical protein
MNTIRKSFQSWAIAPVAILAATILAIGSGSGCEAVEDANKRGGLLGKVGSSLGGFQQKDGKVSLDGAAEAESQRGGAATAPDAEPQTGATSGGTPWHAACERIVNCLLESCPALGTPDVEDVTVVVGDCAAECEGSIDAEQAATIETMACGAVWSELTAEEPELEEMCSDGSFDDDDEDYGDWDDEGYDDWDDEGYGDEDCGF